MFPWELMDDLRAAKSEGVGLIDRAISFEDFQLRLCVRIHQRYRQTDRRTDRRTDGRHANRNSLPHFEL